MCVSQLNLDGIDLFLMGQQLIPSDGPGEFGLCGRLPRTVQLSLQLLPAVAVPCQQQLVQVGRDLFVVARPRGLPSEVGNARSEFVQYVDHALQIALCLIQPAQCLGTARLVMGDAGRFFEERTPFVGTQRKGLVDQALPDDGIGALAQAAGRQQFGDVLQAHVPAVDEVFVLAGTKRATGDLDLGEVDG